jgi:hypothetical protein
MWRRGLLVTYSSTQKMEAVFLRNIGKFRPDFTVYISKDGIVQRESYSLNLRVLVKWSFEITRPNSAQRSTLPHLLYAYSSKFLRNRASSWDALICGRADGSEPVDGFRLYLGVEGFDIIFEVFFLLC